ncbi:hypothetical protein [Variovorax sp. JS1663]|uniref:hypothetical protein n=1 Tax=Variovorax sp. JS1663 TaxID=1851577 RepID=UPI001EDDB39F|nr:hypothetical protein [Variovorax sp. JS1663]
MINAAELRALASKASKAEAAGCVCTPLQTPSWESITDERWPAEVQRVGTLRQADVDEPTFEEFHPDGTRYESADAPVAVAWFPFNRSDVYACSRCRSVFLRYTEYGGYYVDHRVRRVDPQLVVPGPD